MAEPADSPEANNPEDERPDWLPENFKSPDDLVRSYQEAQNKIREQGTQLNALNENYTHLSQQIEEMAAAQNTPTVDPSDVQAQWYTAYEQDPIGTMAALAQQVAQQTVQQQAQQQSQQLAPLQQAQAALVAQHATNELQRRYPDFDQERPRIAQEIDNNPLFQNEEIWNNPTTAAAALDQAYRLVKGSDLLSGNITVAGYNAEQAKIAAQTATGGNPRPEPAQPDPWEAVKNANIGSYQDLMNRQ